MGRLTLATGTLPQGATEGLGLRGPDGTDRLARCGVKINRQDEVAHRRLRVQWCFGHCRPHFLFRPEFAEDVGPRGDPLAGLRGLGELSQLLEKCGLTVLRSLPVSVHSQALGLAPEEVAGAFVLYRLDIR